MTSLDNEFVDSPPREDHIVLNKILSSASDAFDIDKYPIANIKSLFWR